MFRKRTRSSGCVQSYGRDCGGLSTETRCANRGAASSPFAVAKSPSHHQTPRRSGSRKLAETLPGDERDTLLSRETRQPRFTSMPRLPRWTASDAERSLLVAASSFFGPRAVTGSTA
jgi:hypothetical protein